jgi:hypothetical protein
MVASREGEGVKRWRLLLGEGVKKWWLPARGKELKNGGFIPGREGTEAGGFL